MLKQFYKDNEKVQNLEEFISLLEEFADKGYKLEEILNELSLENEKQNVKVDEAVSLMSVHASKGLEFDYLFVIGMVEGLFPLRDADIEEERRLAYVAVTRAKRELVLSYIKTRFNRDSEPLQVSRFLTEMGLIKNRGGFVKIEGDKRTQKNRLVKHPVFGIGKVIGSCKVRNGLKLKIDFGGDVREILDSYVKDI
jgi:DNA helicase-2/ATP-dependent DNA helicase PcrA